MSLLNQPMVKQYVDVIVRFRDDGRLDPMAICWHDGRTFQIDSVNANASMTNPGCPPDTQATVYSVKIRGKRTNLYLERFGEKSKTFAKWYVLMPEGKEPWCFGRNYGI